MKLLVYVFVGSIAAIAAAIWALLSGLDRAPASFKM